MPSKSSLLLCAFVEGAITAYMERASYQRAKGIQMRREGQHIFLQGRDGVFHEGAREQINGAKPMHQSDRLALGHVGVMYASK